MCAIIGAIPHCRISTSFLHHRGPDGHNIAESPDVVFGHTRLAILDLTERASQPLRDGRGRVLLTYNGEIYNFRSLGAANETSDSVALANWLAAAGPGFDAAQIDGMYAFGAWFERTKTLALSRDPAGIKPLYIAFGEDGASLAFASEIKGFYGVEWFHAQPTPDPEVQRDFLQYGYAFPRAARIAWRGHEAVIPLVPTLIQGVFQLCPGQTLIFPNAGAPESRFTELGIATGDPQKELEAAIREQAISDVEVGVQLSGGIDSSLTAWQFAQTHPSVHGFYVSIPGESLNEDEWAVRAAETIGRHTQLSFHKIATSEDTFTRVMPDVFWHMDEPCIRHPNAIGVFLLCEHVRRNTPVKVLLTGEGADEIFGGYSWQDGKTVEAYDHSRRVFDFGGNLAARRFMESNPASSVLERQLGFDRALYLPPILARQDRMSMAHGIEARVPFLANRFLKLPAPLIPGKHALKRMAADIFGPDFASRRKVGFGMPLEWLIGADPQLDALEWMHEIPAAKTSFQRWSLIALSRWAQDYLHGGWKSRVEKHSGVPSAARTNSAKATPIVVNTAPPSPLTYNGEQKANRESFNQLLRGDVQRVPSPVMKRDGDWVEALALGAIWRLDGKQYLDGKILSDGIFEPASTRFVHQAVKPDMVVCDVGGNIGYYTVQFSQLVGPTGAVHAFEPSPRFRARLADHLKINQCENVHLCDFGLSDCEAELTLFGGGDSATLGWHDDAKTPEVQETIRVRALDDYVAEAGLERLDFVKIDIDGSEPNFLKGAEKTLRRFHPTLLMEFMQLGLMEFDCDVLQLARDLSRLGYVLAPEKTGRPWTDRAAFLRDAHNCSVSINVIARWASDDDADLRRQRAFLNIASHSSVNGKQPTRAKRPSPKPSQESNTAPDRLEMTDVEYWDQDRAPEFKPWKVGQTCFSNLFEQHLPHDSSFTCAEIGAYPGTFLCDLAKRRGYQPVAIEYSKHTSHIEEMFRVNGIQNGRVIQEDFFKVRGEQFDVVASFGFIEHFTDPQSVMEAHFNLIKPGGWLVMSVPRVDGFQGLLYELTYTPETWDRVAKSHNAEILNLHALRRTCERYGDVVFADYVRGASVYFDWKAPFVRPEYRWLVRYLNDISDAAVNAAPPNEFYSPHIFIVAQKPVAPKVSTDAQTDALILQARTAIEAEDLATAETALRQCVSVDPGQIEVRAALADILAATGKMQQAINELESSPKPMPQALAVWERLGALRLANGDLAGAEAAFLEVISWNPKHPDALAGLLEIYSRQNKSEPANAVRDRMEALAISES